MNSDAQLEDVFLATTALEEFWDVSKPIVFLGEWCLLYERRSYWKKLNGRLLSSPYDKDEAAENAYIYVNQIYEQILPALVEKLNSVHEKNYSNRYWRILLGPWLRMYLSAVYDRYIFLKQGVAKYAKFSTIGLSANSFLVPSDTLEFACVISEDYYNLQLYTKILHALGKDFPCKETIVPLNPLYGKLLKNSWMRKSISSTLKVFTEVSAKLSKTVLLRNSYFSKQIELKLIFRNIGRILPSWEKMHPCHRFEYDSLKRKTLQLVYFGEDEFAQCLSSMLYSDMPQCFLEGYQALEKAASENYPKLTQAILSANGWYYDEVFKLWAARAAEKGTLLLGAQHGGNYGASQFISDEHHETAIADYYYTWGWERTGSDCLAKVIPMPATKLLGGKEIAPDNCKKEILWVATTCPRYVVHLPYFPVAFHNYLEWQIRFAKTLPEEIQKVTRFRPHREDHGWGISSRMKECTPSIRVESWNASFQESLTNCRLYVCDHLSTTFAEALAVNKPTVLFWNPKLNKLRPEAGPYFELLTESGILFDTPEDAAINVAAVYDDVETWWNAPERQKSIRLFCEQFARTSPDAITLWSNELKRVSDLPSPI